MHAMDGKSKNKCKGAKKQKNEILPNGSCLEKGLVKKAVEARQVWLSG